jgi:hypothetical protein
MRCSARTAPASRRWSNASWASTPPIRARCSSTGASRDRHPRDAHALGIGMVYQHFTLVLADGAENLVHQPRRPAGGDRLAAEKKRARSLLETMPFKVPLDAGRLARRRREAEARDPEAALPRPALPDPRRADLGADAGRGRRGARAAPRMAGAGELTILMITHKFREVNGVSPTSVTVLRRGKLPAPGNVRTSSVDEMAEMMIGDTQSAQRRRPRGARDGRGTRARRAERGQ